MRRFLSLLVFCSLALSASARADDGQEPLPPTGYGASEPVYQYDVAQDGYGGVGVPVETADAPTYVVVESETGTKTEYDGEPILVVKEPEPVAATSEAPPPPQVVPSDEVVIECPSGVWVHGYWDYRAGRYVWVDGHCVAVRVDYVFVAPRWDFYWDIWWFIPGYYRPCGVFVTYGYYRPWHWFPPYPYPYYRTGRPIPEFRGVPTRPTVATPVPATRVPRVTRTPTRPTTVIQTAPSGVSRPVTLGRAGTGPTVTRQGVLGSRHGVDIVTEPRPSPRPSPSLGVPSSSRSRGAFRGRTKQAPSSSGSVWTPSSGSSGSSRGSSGGRSRSSPSSGSSSGSSSGGRGSRVGGHK